MNISKKISVGILGATGSVGQKFIQLLSNHPWFEIAEVAASKRSSGKSYSEAVNWTLSSSIPSEIGKLIVKDCEPDLNSRIVFSGLDSGVAGEIEEKFAEKGYIVITNSRNHRMDQDVPLLVPEINHCHLEMIKRQKYKDGFILANPNCSTIGLVLALKPLYDSFGLEAVNVVTMQALSGAGYPGVASMDIIDNVIPYIPGEEDKLETEPLKILGNMNSNSIEFANIKISAQCNRVSVTDGHLESVQIKLKNTAGEKDLIEAWKNFSSEPQKLQLPTAPIKPIHYFEENNYPQPRIHRNLDKGMAISIGRLRKDSLFDYKFTLLSHNTVRGAAGGAILCAELLIAKDYIK